MFDFSSWMWKAEATKPKHCPHSDRANQTHNHRIVSTQAQPRQFVQHLVWLAQLDRLFRYGRLEERSPRRMVGQLARAIQNTFAFPADMHPKPTQKIR